MAYRILNDTDIEVTLSVLHRRIEERFPGRGLSKLCAELLAVAREDRAQLSWQKRPNFWLRAGIVFIVAMALVSMFWLGGRILRIQQVATQMSDALQGVDALFNIAALSFGGVWFLLNLEAVLRRQAVLNNLHELRSIAHVVDMHQLTKDPTVILAGASYSATASSPSRMNEADLMRYLDYCSEMLSLTGKLAALYMQDVRDPVIIQAVNEIEDLTGNMSRKIWQKMMILRQPEPVKAP
jgi:hypothetical protein